MTHKVQFPEDFFSWGRYLYWSEILFQRFHQCSLSPNENTVENAKQEWRFLALMSQWFAGLWVVIEGWVELDLSNSRIEELISTNTENCSLLKRFRNGVFHYQPNIFDDRLVGFLDKGDDTLLWAWSLQYEFKRYLWEWPSSLGGTSQQTEELFNLLESIIGWVPNDIIPQMKSDVEKMIIRGKEQMLAAGDMASSAAKELKIALDKAERISENLPSGPIYDFLKNAIKIQSE